jgi:Fic family protein
MAEIPVEIPETPYLYDQRQNELIRKIAERVDKLRVSGKLTPQVLGRIRRYFRIKNIYHSNAIEGNTLSVGETRQVVELGLTLTGKPLKDQAEARNLSHALDYLEQLASNNTIPLTESDIRQIHYLVLKDIKDDNAGRYRSVPVEISGSAYKPPQPESVPPQMSDFGKWVASISVPGPEFAQPAGLIRAAVAHTWLVYIHPFIDGNGRVARLLMNLLLIRHGYPIAIITKEDRLRHYDALEQSQTSDVSSFIGLISECIHESLDEYERAVAEQREQEEWARSIAERFTAAEKTKAQNTYELWKSAMELLKSYFRQTTTIIDETAQFMGHVYFKDFGYLEFEKYVNLRAGESTKRTWFFRIDFVAGNKSARYLFFFGFPSYRLKERCDVTLHIAREEAPYFYARTADITAPNVPNLVEVGYVPSQEQFFVRYKDGGVQLGRIEEIGKRFISEIVQMHFSMQ